LSLIRYYFKTIKGLAKQLPDILEGIINGDNTTQRVLTCLEDIFFLRYRNEDGLLKSFSKDKLKQ
jgi:hypothetical protein